MAKLHELLAAENSVFAAHNAISEETLKVFGKPDAFTRQTETITYFDSNDAKLNQSATKDNVTTVDERLAYSFGRAFVNHIDFLAQKNRTNQEASADLIVNGAVLAADLPGTFLLNLETQLELKKRELLAIPTLRSGPEWTDDNAERMWRTKEPIITFRTKKTLRPVTLAQATKEHPEQVQAINEDIPVAKIERLEWSSMWTSAQKHDALARLEVILIATRKARQRANRQNVVKLEVASKIAQFILSGPPSELLTGTDTVEEAA